MLQDTLLGLEDDLLLLQQAYFNERSSPELLSYLADSCKNLLDVLSYQQGNILTEQQQPMTTLMKTIYELEIERVKYLIRVYIELRLEKVDYYCTSSTLK